MKLKILNNNANRVVIGVEFDTNNEIDKYAHANFDGTEELITIDKGHTEEWTIHYNNDTKYSFSRGGVCTIYGKEVSNIVRLCSRLLTYNFITTEEKLEQFTKMSYKIFDAGSTFIYGVLDNGIELKIASLSNNDAFENENIFSISNLLNKDNRVSLVSKEEDLYNGPLKCNYTRYEFNIKKLNKEDYKEIIVEG